MVIELRKHRCYNLEPTFAQIKHNNNFKRFFLRGKMKIKIKTRLFAIAHNHKNYIKQPK
ncbi:MAG: transposase [Cloacibacterium sp.]|nr:transposase [Cloacibacterium sp.]